MPPHFITAGGGDLIDMAPRASPLIYTEAHRTASGDDSEANYYPGIRLMVWLRRTQVTTSEDSRPPFYARLLLAAAAVFVAAGGFVHAREWLETYRNVPAEVAGSAVVRIGFPINVVISLLVVAALGWCALKRSRFTLHVAAAAAVFQLGSLAALVVSHRGSLFGWTEPTWTLGAQQTLAVEIGALVSLAGFALIALLERRSG